jgi:hypothetical protein
MEYVNKKRNTKFSCDNSLHQNRFKTTLSLLQIGGIPLNIISQSNIYKFYYPVGAVCYYTILFCIFMDVYVHRYDLVQLMKKTPILLTFSFCEWMNRSLRYVTKKFKFTEILVFLKLNKKIQNYLKIILYVVASFPSVYKEIQINIVFYILCSGLKIL